MSKIRIALAPGDGIGPEVMRASLDVLEAAGVGEHVVFEAVEMGAKVFARGDSRGMSDEAISAIEQTGILYKGPMGTPIGTGGKSINVSLRKMYGAFANIRHFRSLPGVETVYSKAGVPVNFYVIRENVEDTYGGIEHRLTNDVIECKRLISAPGSDQVHRTAMRTARRLGITRVHCGHKANIMKMTDGLFLDRFRVVARDFPEIEALDVIIDALCMKLVLRPGDFQLVVLTNLQGDIVSDLAAGLVGGLGFAPSANIGHHVSIFEAVHGTAPDIAGQNRANPTSLILSGLMMLRHIGLLRMAATIENALLATLEDGVHTGDFGAPEIPAVGTKEFGGAIIERLGCQPKEHEAVAVPQSEKACLERPKRPSANTLMQTFTQVKSEYVGADLYLESTMAATELAVDLQRLSEDTLFELTMMSNRGTQVWPSGSIYTECVDYWRVRFELRDRGRAGTFGQGPVIALMGKVGEKYTITDYQPLREFDGQAGYTLAQGQ